MRAEYPRPARLQGKRMFKWWFVAYLCAKREKFHSFCAGVLVHPRCLCPVRVGQVLSFLRLRGLCGLRDCVCKTHHHHRLPHFFFDRPGPTNSPSAGSLCAAGPAGELAPAATLPSDSGGEFSRVVVGHSRCCHAQACPAPAACCALGSGGIASRRFSRPSPCSACSVESGSGHAALAVGRLIISC